MLLISYCQCFYDFLRPIDTRDNSEQNGTISKTIGVNRDTRTYNEIYQEEGKDKDRQSDDNIHIVTVCGDLIYRSHLISDDLILCKHHGICTGTFGTQNESCVISGRRRTTPENSVWWLWGASIYQRVSPFVPPIESPIGETKEDTM